MSKPETDTPPPQQMMGEPIADDGKKKPQGCHPPRSMQHGQPYKFQFPVPLPSPWHPEDFVEASILSALTESEAMLARLAKAYCAKGECPRNSTCLPKLSDTKQVTRVERETEEGFDVYAEISAKVECFCDDT